MSYCAEIKIPESANSNLKFYIYRSKNATDINTIAKVKNLLPVLIIDETLCKKEDGIYTVYDNINKTNDIAGVTYLGPEPVLIPTTEYESEISFVQYNKNTYSPIITLKPLETDYSGTLYYYSVIGVDDENDLITHLSKVSAVLMQSDYQNNGSREIFSCENYTGMPDDEWNSVATIDWQSEIQIGDTDNPIAINRFGYPFSNTVPIFKQDEVKVNNRHVSLFNQITINVPNIWRGNNKEYNFRKLKSYKIRNVHEEKYGDFSIPTYQSEMPISMEKMVVLRKNVTSLSSEDQLIPCDLNKIGEEIENPLTIIRKNGVYYNIREHGILNTNKYLIPSEDTIAVFSESSVQSDISMVFQVEQNKTYNYTFYLFDVYGKKSNPLVILAET